MSGKGALVLLTACVLFGCDRIGGLFGQPPGKVWHVKAGAFDQDGETWDTAFGHPMDAMNAASYGDEIWVAAGTYTSGGTWPVLEMRDGVKVYGGFAGWETDRYESRPWENETILDGQDTCYHVVLGASDARLDGFTVTGGNANGPVEDAHGGGIFTQNSSLTVANCTFSNNSAIDVGGGMANLWSSSTVTNCTFSGNTAANGGGAMFNTGSSSPLVSNCVFMSNSGGWGGALHNNGSAAPTIVNCTFTANSAVSEGGAMYVRDDSVTTVKNCIFWNDSAPSGQEVYVLGPAILVATYSCIQGGWGGTGNIDADPLFMDAPNGDLRLERWSPCLDAADGGPAPDRDIEGRRRYDDYGAPNVGTGSPDYVDMGAYERQDIRWYVDCDVAMSGNGRSWSGAFATVQQAVDAASWDDMIAVAEGTYYRWGSSGPVLQMYDGVRIYGGFGGLGTWESSWEDRDLAAHETILDGDNMCRVVEGASYARLDGFTITRGNAGAPGPSPDSCGGGMQNWWVSDVVVANCRFLWNQASWHGGGIINDQASGIRIMNCVFWNNAAGMCGGAIENNLASIEVANCTFSGNWDSCGGGAIYNNIDTGSQSVRNCILWGDSGGEIHNDSGASAAVAYSCIQGGWAGTGNISSDPQFVNAGGGDLHLQSASLCTDAADGNWAPATDIEGRARYDNPAKANTGTGSPNYVDMGAHEYQ